MKVLTHVDGEFAQVRVELTREAQAGGDTRHDDRDEVVEIAVGDKLALVVRWVGMLHMLSLPVTVPRVQVRERCFDA